MKKNMVKLDEMKPVKSSNEWKENISLFTLNNIIIDAKTRQAEFKEHWGPLSIKCAFNGVENYYCKGFQYAVSDANYLVFNEGKYYGSYIDSESVVESFTIHFSPEYIQNFFHSIFANPSSLIDAPFEKVNRHVVFSEHLRPHDKEISPILMKLRKLSVGGDYISHCQIDELYSALLLKLLIQQKTIDSSFEEFTVLRLSTKQELSRRLLAGREFIIENYKQDIALDDIAKAACLNKFYYLRLFNSIFRTTPHQFLTRLRVSDASRLLISSEMNITQVCNNVGFSDPASFSKLFKRYYKFSPLEYRNHFTPRTFGMNSFARPIL